MLEVAIGEARVGLAEGGIPIGAAVFGADGTLLGTGHNRRVQEGDPSAHGETDAFRRAGRQRSYREMTMVTTLAPCWYCSGLIRQFGFKRLIVGESDDVSGRNRLAAGDWGRGGGPRLRRMQGVCWAGLFASGLRCGMRILGSEAFLGSNPMVDCVEHGAPGYLVFGLRWNQARPARR